METLEQALQQHFSYPSFRAHQKEIITSILSGKNVFAMLHTGAGKSLCYQLPAAMCEGITIVVSPLLSLMENQVQELKMRGFKRVATYNSFLSYREKKYILSHLTEYKLLYIAPESLHKKEVYERLRQRKVALFAVDEAHCISQWGHEFRTDYLKLGEIKSMLGNPPCLALTATATPIVRKDIIRQLQMDSPVELIATVDRSNISYEVVSAHGKEEKESILLERLAYASFPGMIYAGTRRVAEELAALLKEHTSFRVAAYHGGMTAEDRQLIQQQFLQGTLDVITCTNAFGMGMNKKDIRFVYHYDVPKDMESYVQETGRAGRDGKASEALLLYRNEDLILPRQMIEGEFPKNDEIQQVNHLLTESFSNENVFYFLQDNTSLEETHLRLLIHYWEIWRKEQNKPYDLFVMDQITKRKRQKLKKLREMYDWMNTTTCRREFLLSYFGESMKKKVSVCCDNCGIERTKKRTWREVTTKERDWKKQLAVLFHQYERG